MNETRKKAEKRPWGWAARCAAPAWMGVLELSTGALTFVNAGHNPPLVGHAGGGYEYLRSRPGFVLAGMEGTRYRPGSLTLAPGDTPQFDDITMLALRYLGPRPDQ